MSTELEAENAKLRFEVETLKAQRNSAQKKAKLYHRKWKGLVQEREMTPTTLKILVDRLQEDRKLYAKADGSSGTEDALVWSSVALYVERLLGLIPTFQKEAHLKISTAPNRQPKPREVLDIMVGWLESQIGYKKESRNDISYGDGEDDRLHREQEAYERALNELTRLRKSS